MIHVIMPFSRPEMSEIYRQAFLNEANTAWHPISSKQDGTGDICYEKINSFPIPRIEDSEYYTFLCDDDFWEPGYFTRIQEHPQTPVIITSMKRGDHAIGHGTSTLMAHPDNMRVGEIGLEQIVLRGDVFREYRFNSMNSCADGEMAERLKTSGLPITYCRDAFTRFNWFQPGRWDK